MCVQFWPWRTTAVPQFSQAPESVMGCPFGVGIKLYYRTPVGAQYRVTGWLWITLWMNN